MANNVTNIIKIVANDEAIQSIDNRFDVAGGYADTKLFVKAFYDNFELSESGDVLNSWSLDNVGSKWIYVENSIDKGEWNVQSANYPPHEFLEKLYNLVTEIDSDGYIEIRYNDEFYSPVGAMVFKKDNNNSPTWYDVEDYDFELPEDDDDDDTVQTDFIDSVCEFQENAITECNIFIKDGFGKEFKTKQNFNSVKEI